MEIPGELSSLFKEQIIEFTNPEYFCFIKENRSTRKDRSRSQEDMKIKESIDLLMKREPEGMDIFLCWTCKEFGHFLFRWLKRVRKTRKSARFDDEEEFNVSNGTMERFLNDYDDNDNELELVKKEEVVEEIALVTIVDPKANHENVEVIIETNNDLQNGNQI